METSNELSQQLAEMMASMMPSPLNNEQEAIHIGQHDVPEVTLPDGSGLQLLHVDLNQNLWIVRNRFKPGFAIDTHYHSGPVFAFTHTGEWFYKEYPQQVNKAGSYLFEPAHSVHTLTVAADAKEDALVSFVIFGSNINLDEQGGVSSILDAKTILKAYTALCELEGKRADRVIVVGSVG